MICQALSHRCHVCVTNYRPRDKNAIVQSVKKRENVFGSIFLKAPISFTVYYTALHLLHLSIPALPPLNEINFILPRQLNHFPSRDVFLANHMTELRRMACKCYDGSRVFSLRPILSNHLQN